MRLKQSERPPRREADLTSLINVIFLILIFFMTAGALRPFANRDLKLAQTPQSNPAQPALGRLIAAADGALIYRNQPVTLDGLAAALAMSPSLDRTEAFTLIADARLDALNALAIIAALRSAGHTNIALLTERRPGRP